METIKRVASELVPSTPLIASTIWRHYSHGPPAKTWGLKLHLVIALLLDRLKRMQNITVEEIQTMSYIPEALPDFAIATPATVPNEYRAQAHGYLLKLLEGLDDEIGWDWKEDWRKREVAEITGAWFDVMKDRNPVSYVDKETTVNKLTEHTDGRVILYFHGGAYYIGSVNTHNNIILQITEKSAARTLAINYRLAPQNPFPSAVEDALASYLYLLKPPLNSGLLPTDPKKIVIMGDSAGGGLTMATLLAIRDAGLPMPGGGVGISPWIDLTSRLPSLKSNTETDFLPKSGFAHKESPATRYEGLPTLDGRKILIDQDGNVFKRRCYYAPNKALKIKYVSPLFDDKHLEGLPPLLIQAGNGELLRDESILAAYKASGMTHGHSTKTSQNPVTLELYSDMPHVFQLFGFTQEAAISFQRIGDFVRNVTNPDSELTAKEPLEVYVINAKDPIEALSKQAREEQWNEAVFAEWEKNLSVGVDEY